MDLDHSTQSYSGSKKVSLNKDCLLFETFTSVYIYIRAKGLVSHLLYAIS